MGAFLLHRHGQAGNPGISVEKACDMMVRQGFKELNRVGRPDYTLHIFDKLVTPTCNCIEFPNGDFCAAIGTYLFEGLVGEPALRKLYAEFDPNASHSGRLYGAFCIVICKNSKTRLVIDRLGVYKAYVDTEHSIWSSSFLALCAALPQLDVAPQSLYEYVFQGATYGDCTLFENIKTVDSNKVYHVDNSLEIGDRRGRLAAQVVERPVDHHVEQVLGSLRTYYRDIAECFGDSIDTALSGGYDSRLTLALLLEQGVRPSVHVYGKSTDVDVMIAKKIEAGETLGLVHIDKSQYSPPNVSQFPRTVEKNFFSFDGYPTDGIFNNGADLATRRDRCAGGKVMLNGGGGEVFRNFFYLRNKPFRVLDILWTFYSRFDPAVCSARFSENDYHTALAEKVKFALFATSDRITRSQVEAIYPLFRCRYWMGRNNSVNNRFGFALTPFIDYVIVRHALAIPLAEKYFGEFEARLLRAVSHKLASYDSAYGHSFAEKAPLKRRVSELLVYARPPRLRKYSYRVQQRGVTSGPSGTLAEDYLRSVLKDDFPFLNEFFQVADIRDVAQFNRICTLEYLLQYFSSKASIGR